MKNKALKFLIEFLLPKFEKLPLEAKNKIINNLYLHDSWEEFINTVKLNRDDSVKWVMCNLKAWDKTFDFDEFIVDEKYDDDSNDHYIIFNIEDKFIRINLLNYDSKTGCFQKIEYDFVEQKEILVPKKIWITLT